VSTATRTFSIVIAPQPTTTNYFAPTANAAVTSSAGDNNGFQTNPTNAYAADGLFAVDTDSGSGNSTSCTAAGKDKHVFFTYSFGIPTTAVAILGIEVRLNARVDATAGDPRMCVQLSWNGGVSWTAAQSTATLTTSNAAYTLGTPTQTWGRTWVPSEMSNTNFRLRIINVASSTARDFSLDAVAVRVSYQ
jgi:hypothetical protein